MAEKDHNEEPEEEKKNQFEEDDDFGLPDLDYDEFGDEEDLDIDFEDEFGSDEEIETEVAAEETNTPAQEESIPEIESKEEETSDVEDFNAEFDTEDSEDDFGSDLNPEDLEDLDTFYEEESFDEFEDEIDLENDTPEEETIGASVFDVDQSEEKIVDSSSEDDFFTGFEQSGSGSEVSSEEYPLVDNDEEENEKGDKSKFLKLIVIGVVVLFGLGITFYLLSGDDDTEKKVAKVDKTEQKPEPKPAPVKEKVEEKPVQPEKVVEQKPQEKPKANKKPAAANSVAAGTITTLSNATGKSYIVIASFFDGDMAQDHAKKLSNEGKSPYVIPPFNDYRFYRVAIAEFDNFGDASASVAQYQADYGKDVWPLKY